MGFSNPVLFLFFCLAGLLLAGSAVGRIAQEDLVSLGLGCDELLKGMSTDLARLERTPSFQPWRDLLRNVQQEADASGKSFLQRRVSERHVEQQEASGGSVLKTSATADPLPASSSSQVLAARAAMAQLPAMTGVMEAMEKDWKKKISVANREEKDEKKKFAATVKALDAKAKTWDPKLGKNDYTMIENYFKRQRALAHKQYHNLLKIAHAGIERFQSTLRAMKEAQAGKPLDSKAAAVLHLSTTPTAAGGAGETPEVVLLAIAHQVRSVDAWAREAAQQLATQARAASSGLWDASVDPRKSTAGNATAASTPTVAAMEARLRKIAVGMRKISSNSAGKATDATSAGFNAMAKVADEAAAALAEVEKAKDEREKRRLLEQALGPKGLGTWMARLTSHATATDQEAEEQESELLLSLLMRRAHAWPLAKHLEVLASFSEKGSYPAFETLTWSLKQKPVEKLEVQAMSAHLAQLMDARHKAPPKDSERAAEKEILEKFTAKRKLTKVLKQVKLLAAAAPDDKAREALGTAKMEARLQKVLSDDKQTPKDIAAAMKEALVWASQLKDPDGAIAGLEDHKKPAKLVLTQIVLPFSDEDPLRSEMLVFREAVALLTGEN